MYYTVNLQNNYKTKSLRKGFLRDKLIWRNLYLEIINPSIDNDITESF